MGIFKRFFGIQKTDHPYQQLPQLPILPIPLPATKKAELSVGKFSLDKKLGELSQARPRRNAALWQCADESGRSRLLFVVPPDEDHKKWLLDRIGGEVVLQDFEWNTIDSKKVWPGMGYKFNALSFSFYLDNRYCLSSRLYADDYKETWEAEDLQGRQKVLCVVVKAQVENLEEQVSPRSFQGKEGLLGVAYPGLMDTLAEGSIRTIGPFAAYRYKYTRLFYAITQAPPTFFSLQSLMPTFRLTWEQGMSVLYQAGRLLHCLHEKKWIHGQISPEQLFLSPENKEDANVCLSGFSLAHLQRDAQSTFFKIVHKFPHDTQLPYLAPEQSSGGGCTPYTDQFLLGITVYSLITGVNPFSGPTANAMKKRLQKGEITPLQTVCPDAPDWFSRTLQKMTDPDPKKRFENLKNMIEWMAKKQEEHQWAEGEEIVSVQTENPKKQEKEEKTEKREKPRSEPSPQGDAPMLEEEEFEEFVVSPQKPPSEGTGKGFDAYLFCHPYRPFQLGEKFTIGRHIKNDLVLSSDDVSSFHASISLEGKEYVIRDMQSSNGTQLNGKYVTRKSLKNKDRIMIGANTIMYREVPEGTSLGEEIEGIGRRPTLQLQKFGKESRSANTSSTISGDLSHLSLWQILQMLAAEEKTGCLTVIHKETAKIFFSRGRIVHCALGVMKGYDAFYSVLYFQEGKFSFDISVLSEESTMDDVVESLLLEGARRMDEQMRQE